MLQHFTDLAQATGDDRLAHCHVLEDLCRRTEEIATVSERNVRRDKNIARVQQRRYSLMLDSPREDYPAPVAFRLQQPLNFAVQTTAADDQKAHGHVFRNRLDRAGKFYHTMPRTKRPDKPRDDVATRNPQFAPRVRPGAAANAGPKQLRVNAIRIQNDLLSSDTSRFEVPPFHVRHNKNTRRREKVQSLV